MIPQKYIRMIRNKINNKNRSVEAFRRIVFMLIFSLGNFIICTSANLTVFLNNDTIKNNDTNNSGYQKAYDELLNSALTIQIKVDSMLRLANQKSDFMDNLLNEKAREELNNEIYKLKKYAADLQEKVDKKYRQVRDYEANTIDKETEKNTTNTKDTISVEVDTTINDIKVYKYNFPKDSLKEYNNKTDIKNTGKEVKESKNKFKIFNKPQYNADHPVPMDPVIPEDLLFRIQLGVFSEAPAPKKFLGLYPVSGAKTNNGLIKYYVGFFDSYTKAEEALSKVKSTGFSDAYIVSFYKQKKIPLDKAKNYEAKQ